MIVVDHLTSRCRVKQLGTGLQPFHRIVRQGEDQEGDDHCHSCLGEMSEEPPPVAFSPGLPVEPNMFTVFLKMSSKETYQEDLSWQWRGLETHRKVVLCKFQDMKNNSFFSFFQALE